MADDELPGWEGTDWDTTKLGDVVLPGIVTVEDLEVGIDIDTKKARGAECPTSTDNGLRASKFKLRVALNIRMWREWQAIAPSIQPRRPGHARQPVQIENLLVNHLGITEIRIAGIKAQSPRGDRGLVFFILCEEWFDKPKPVAKNETPVPIGVQREAGQAAADAARTTAQQMAIASEMAADRDAQQNDTDRDTGKSLKPSDDFNIHEKMFGPPGTGLGS